LGNPGGPLTPFLFPEIWHPRKNPFVLNPNPSPVKSPFWGRRQKLIRGSKFFGPSPVTKVFLKKIPNWKEILVRNNLSKNGKKMENFFKETGFPNFLRIKLKRIN